MDIQVGDKVQVKATHAHGFSDGEVGFVASVHYPLGAPEGYVEYVVKVGTLEQILIEEEFEKIVE